MAPTLERVAGEGGVEAPRFYADERALPIGVRVLTALTLGYMSRE